jgi:sulfide dehydrogenase cytochrome subunit
MLRYSRQPGTRRVEADHGRLVRPGSLESCSIRYEGRSQTMIVKAGRPVLMLGLVTCLSGGAGAADTSGRDLAANCTGCHGTSGVSTGGIPTLAGVDRARIVQLMQEFRDGKRPATLMHQLAKGYTDEQIQAMASWLAAQK